jgi:glycyl-tRNA synthetase beta chain
VQGAVRILMDLPELTGIDREIAIGEVFDRAATLTPEAKAAAQAFVLERVRFILEHRGLAGPVVRGATPSADVSPLRARRVAEALQGMRASEDFQGLAVLFKRVKNIAPSTGSGQAKELTVPTPVDRDALVEPAERALLAELDARRPKIQTAVGRSDYRTAFSEIAGLRAAVDRFFTEVFVMADDARLRTARLALMADLRDLILHLADISEIIPQTE